MAEEGMPRMKGMTKSRQSAAPKAAAVVPEAARETVEVVEATAQAAMPNPAQLAEAIESVTSPPFTGGPIPAPAVEPVEPALQTPDKEESDMATIATPTDATDKAQAMFGDFSQRLKTAFEKSTKLSEDMVELAKGNVEAVIASARVAAKAGESFGQEAAEYGKKNFETATAAFKSFATVKSPTELFQLQSEFAKASFDSAVAEASRVSESLMKAAGDIAQPLSNRYAIAAEKIKATSL